MANKDHYFKLHVHSVENEEMQQRVQFVEQSRMTLHDLSDDIGKNTVNVEVVNDEFDIDGDFVFKVGQTERKHEAVEILDSSEIEKKSYKKSNKSKVNFVNGGRVDKKASYMDLLLGLGRQMFVSFVVLIMGFVLLNASSFYENAKYKIKEIQGYESPLHGIAVEVKDVVYSQEVLTISSDPDIQKTIIPELDLEVAPVDDRIIIPRIDKNIPVIRVGSENVIKRDWQALETQMQDALKNGVVYYPGTSQPGQTGNVVITGHSSYFPWDPGRFKDVFALLHEVVVGDNIVVYHNQDKYLYEIEEIKVVKPDEVEVLKQTPEDQLTLITCTPVGTNLKRLIVIAKPVQINNSEIIQRIMR